MYSSKGEYFNKTVFPIFNLCALSEIKSEIRAMISFPKITVWSIW